MAAIEKQGSIFRPIHYLGSKLRLVSDICEAVSEVATSGDRVLDLFSGSGTVSNALSAQWDTVSCDVQEYSRVLCSALILPGDFEFCAENIVADARGGKVHSLLCDAYADVLEYEEDAFRFALEGDISPLFSIIESGYLHPSYLERDRSRLGLLRKKCITRADKICCQNENLITKYYGGIYFSYSQAVALDALLSSVSQMDCLKRDIAMAALLSTASEIVNTVGKQFAQPLRVKGKDGEWKKSLRDKVVSDRCADVYSVFCDRAQCFIELGNRRSGNAVVRSDCFDYLKTVDGKKFEAIYADPPYTRYHYSRYYHVLETIALHDFPVISNNPATKKPSRGVYRADRHQSPFSTKTGALSAFEQLFQLCGEKSDSLILSYSPYQEKRGTTPRVVSVDQLMDCASGFYSSVALRQSKVEITHSKLNRSGLSLESLQDAEVLIICKK